MTNRVTRDGRGRALIWAFSITALVLLLFAIGYTCLVVLALAALAPEITVWPLITALALGLTTAIVGLVLASRKPRWSAVVVINAVATVGHFGGLVLVFLPVLLAVEQRYVIPDGYMGQVVIVHGVASGVAEQRAKSGAVTYDIPETGLLITTGGPIRTWIRDQYFYRRRDGSLKKIEARWNTTIHDTPENRADPSDGIYLRTGTGVMNSPGCRPIEFHSFVVGTKPFILSGYPSKAHEAMVEAVQQVCGKAGATLSGQNGPPNKPYLDSSCKRREAQMNGSS